MSTPTTSSPRDQGAGSARKRGPTRKRGAQSGNRNAYKHGFYAHAFQASDQIEISSPGRGWLQDEINLLRVLIANIAQDIQPAQNLSFQENISALYTVSLALARLDSLRRTNTILQAPADSDKRLMDVLKGMGYTDAEIQAGIDEMHGGPPAAPMTTERWVELLKGMGYTDEEIQTENNLPLPRPTAKKARGGQAGNTNALKHGFYASLFNSAERRRLEKFDPDEIDDDVALLRVLTKRVAAAMLHPPQNVPLTLGQRLAALRVITYASARLEKLQRTKLLLRGPEPDILEEAIHAATDELLKEHGWQV
jgi:hypothetical protein